MNEALVILDWKFELGGLTNNALKFEILDGEN
jgi:hypothetical protein